MNCLEMSNKVIMSSFGSIFSSCSLLICRNLMTFMKKVKILVSKNANISLDWPRWRYPDHANDVISTVYVSKFECEWKFEIGWFFGGYLVRLLHLGMVCLSVVMATMWQMVMVFMSVDGASVSLCIQPSPLSINIFGIYYCFHIG